MKKELVTKIILWTQEALHYGKITGSDDEIAERCMKDIEFDTLCDPGFYANDIDTIGNCPNCGVEYHIHKL